MTALPRPVSITKASAMVAGLLALGAMAAWPAGASAAGTSACGPGGYPSFCGIPRIPTDVRGPAAFRSAVVDTRRAGRGVVRATGPDTFGLPLGEADAFSRAAQAQAAPPAEVSAAPSGDSEATAAELRRRAAPPPPRPH